MADTMEFGPEWLRSLPENSQSSGSRFNKTAKRRYGREEMLAFCKDKYTPPAHLRKFPHIFREETQPPISLQPMSEEEERVMTNGVNSQLGLRTGRGGPVARGIGRGGGVERGRGRGRGRGESYSLRGPAAENGDIGGGFSRLRGPAKDSWDGWEDLRKGDRGFGRPYEDVGRGEGHPRFSRSVSHENWRDRGGDDDDDDWRKPANRDRWSTRTHWREPASRGGVDFDRRNGAFSRGRGFESDDRGRRQGESRDFDELADDGADDLGALDSRGAFISPREDHRERTHKSDHHHHTIEDHHQKWNRKPPLAENEKDTNFERRKPSHPSPPPHSTNSGDTPSPTTKSDTKSPPGKQDDNAISSIAAMTVASVMPSMPQGMTLTNIISDEKTEAKNATATSMTDENALKWFYTDPQDEIQGPFTGEQMAQWFSAGFFNLNLLVKRGCDHQFQPLRDLMKQCGHVPFLPGPSRPPVTQMTTLPTEPSNAVTATTAGPAAAVMAAVTGATQPTLPANTLAPSLPFSLSLGGIGVGVGGGASADNFAAQQYLIQNQIVQHHTGMKELYMQTLAQLQKQETFARLDPAQQQQLCMQVIQANPMMPQLMQQLQHLQLLQQGLTAPSGAAVTTATAAALSSLPLDKGQTSTDTTMPTSTPSLQRSVSQPSARGEVEEDVASIWGSLPPSKGWTGSQPSSVWDLDNVPTVKPVQSHLDTNTQEKTTATLAYLMEEEKEKLRREQEEVRRQAEALQRERERMEREKEEFERQRQLQIQRVEEIRKQAEEEKRKLEIEEMERKKREKEEEERRKMQEQEEEEERRRNLEKEEERRRIQQKEEEGRVKKQEKEEEERRKKQQKEEQRRKKEEKEEEERKKKAEEQKKKEEQLKKKEEEKRKKEDKRKQQEEERQKKQEEARRKKEAEEKAQQEKQQQEEFLRQLEAEKQAEAAEKKQQEFRRQQMEALQQLQQKQALHITELPSTVSWARQSSQGHAGPSRTLMDIQQEEERLRQQQQSEELARQQAEQLELQLQQQQQQQKSWGKSGKRQQPQRGKTLMEIQQEEERQLQQEQHKVHQRQQHQAKSMSLSQAAAWGGSSSSSASSAAPWNSASSSSQVSSVWGSVDTPSSGIWGASEPSLPTRGSQGKKSGRDSNKSQISSEFPALRSEKSHNSSRQQGAKSLPGKSKKEEEAIQRLFKETPEEKDEMTMWTEAYLESMNFKFSVPTFVNLLQSVESTSELRDYVVSYLGEGKRAMEFLKKFIEKRKMCMDKPAVEPEPEEDSIWGPLPTQSSRGASGVRLLNPPQGATMTSTTGDAGGKAKGGKKKKKMQKRDASSLLGFTVHRDPNRTNAGEIETIH